MAGVEQKTLAQPEIFLFEVAKYLHRKVLQISKILSDGVIILSTSFQPRL